MHDNQGRIYTENGQGIDVRGDVAYVLGRSTGDVGQLCGDVDGNGVRQNKINKWALYKPISHPNIGYVTLTERIAKFHGYTPASYDFACYVGSGGSLVGTPFSTHPQPGKWTYNPPTGGIGVSPYRVFDFAHIESDLSRLSEYGYNHIAKAPISFAENGGSVTFDIGVRKIPVDIGNIVFSLNGSSLQSSGDVSNIEIFLNMLKPMTAFPSGYYNEPFFTEDGGARPFNIPWQFAYAIAIKVSASTYAWLFVSSETPFEDYWMKTTWSVDQIYQHHICIGSDMAPGALLLIKRAIQSFGQTTFDCIPILAQNLQYDSTNGYWYFPYGNEWNKAITFPDGDCFSATFTGVANTLRLTLPGSKTYTVGGQTYNIAIVSGIAGMNIPIPASASTSGRFSLGYTLQGYGRNVDFQAGFLGSFAPVTLYDASGNVITEIGSVGQGQYEASGKIEFDTTFISQSAKALSQAGVYQFDTEIMLRFTNADNMSTVLNSFPLRVIISH